MAGGHPCTAVGLWQPPLTLAGDPPALRIPASQKPPGRSEGWGGLCATPAGPHLAVDGGTACSRKSPARGAPPLALCPFSPAICPCTDGYHKPTPDHTPESYAPPRLLPRAWLPGVIPPTLAIGDRPGRWLAREAARVNVSFLIRRPLARTAACTECGVQMERRTFIWPWPSAAAGITLLNSYPLFTPPVVQRLSLFYSFPILTPSQPVSYLSL